MNLIDALGQHHQVAQSSPRIVSLVPSLTELLFDLGLGSFVVGRTGFCIHPATEVASVPKVGGTKDVNIEKIRRLAPTHLIVNIDENEKPTVDALAEFVPHIIVTHPRTVRDNLALYDLFGSIFNVPDAAKALMQAFELAYAKVQPAQQERVLYCIWRDPWMSVGPDTYISQMLALKNWQQWKFYEQFSDKFNNIAARYPVFEWDKLPLSQIDRILLSTEPYRFTSAHCEQLAQKLQRPVQLVDGEMLSWYGSRAVQGLVYLQNITKLCADLVH